MYFILQVNVVDGWFFKLLKPFIERSLRKTKPEDRHVSGQHVVQKFYYKISEGI